MIRYVGILALGVQWAGVAPLANTLAAENEAFRRALDQPVRVVWQGVPLKQAISALSESQDVSVLIDRRIDPAQRLSEAGESRPLREHFQQIAKDLDIGVAYVGSTVYLGPIDVSDRLATVAAMRRQDAARLAPGRRRAWLSEEVFEWDDLSTPRGLIERIAAKLQCAAEGIERIPHDLWAAAKLPALAPADQLTLIAAQFNQTYEIDPQGRRITFVDLPQHAVLERSYPGGRNPPRLAERWRQLAPAASIRVADGRVVVAGRIEDHRHLNDRRDPMQSSEPHTPRLRRHTLAVSDAPLRRVLDQLAEQLGLQIVTDDDAIAHARLTLDALVTIDVQNATKDELLQAVLEPAGFTFRREGARVDVAPADH